MKKIILYLLPFVLMGCGGGNTLESPADELRTLASVKSNLEFLASDELEGREAATRAEKVASQFIASELQKYGVTPFGDSGTYFQNFRVKLLGFEENSSITLKQGDSIKELKITNDFVRAHYVIPPSFNETKNKAIVFAGYGITSGENNYDDYRNTDVKDKVVLILGDVPIELQSSADYFRMAARIDMAQAKGAAGVLIIPSENILKKWSLYESRSTSKSYRYNETEKKNEEMVIPAALLTKAASINLLREEEYSYEKLRELADSNKSLPSFKLKNQIDFNINIKTEYATVRNVVGLIEGKDNLLANEYVSICAHYDHDGIKNGVVYNGANDNASGTTTLLETAKQLAVVRNNNRPIIVIFFTAEEKGLIGSKHFTAASKIIDNIIVNINLDMVGSGSADTLFSVGSGRLSRELADLTLEANDNSAQFVFNYKFDDPDDPERIYYRSDHYNFAKRGIPSVFFTAEDTLHYHKPSDDAANINFNKLVKVSKLVFTLAERIANLDHRLRSDAGDVTSN